MDGLLTQLFDIKHAPFVGVACVLAAIYQGLSLKLFTRARAYRRREGRLGRIAHVFWYWGRELLKLHGVILGALLGLVWRDPEGGRWPLWSSVTYFAAAGFAALFVWALVKGYAKQQGIALEEDPSMPPTPSTTPGVGAAASDASGDVEPKG